MYKFSLVTLLGLATTQISAYEPSISVNSPSPSFNGFYLGAQLGWTQRNDNTKFQALDMTILGGNRWTQNSLDKTNTANGLNYGIYAGYGQNHNGFYWGVEFNISDDTASKGVTNNNLNIVNDALPPLYGRGRLYTKYHRGTVFGFAPRVGAVIANENLLYVKLGLEYSHDKISYQYVLMLDGNPEEDKKEEFRKKRIVFVPGLGYERAFGKMLTRIEYSYNFAAGIQSKGLIEDPVSNNKYSRATVKYSAHVIKLGFGYQF